MDRLEQLILKLLSEAVRLAETFLCVCLPREKTQG